VQRAKRSVIYLVYAQGDFIWRLTEDNLLALQYLSGRSSETTLFIRDIMFYLAWEPLCVARVILSSFSSLCIRSYSPNPTVRSRLSSSLFFPPSSESSSNSSFPSTNLSTGFCRLSLSLSLFLALVSLSFSFPQPLSHSPSLSHLALLSLFLLNPRISSSPILPTTRLIPSSPLIRSLCFSPTCVSRPFPPPSARDRR